jgi:uncharacterized protein YcbX
MIEPSSPQALPATVLMKIDSLYRYPIKGLSPEALPSADVETGHGFAFDRLYAVTDGSFVFDEANPVPMPKTHFLMLARFERLALLKTKFNPDTHHLEVATSDSLYKFSLKGAEGRKALAVFLTQFLAKPLRGEAEVVQAEGHQFTDVSVHSPALMRSISLINLATLRDLGDHVGRYLDPRRFRANIYFDGAAPWSELDWVGRTLRSGNVLIKIVRRTRRCPATSVDLERGMRDLNVPRSILDYRGHADCGIYGEILCSGRLQPSAKLCLLDDQQAMPEVFVSSEAGRHLLNPKETSQ